MTKILMNRLIISMLAVIAFTPVLVLAATTAFLSPTNVGVAAGQTFNVVIGIDPGGIANYAEKLEVDYPADILEAKSFTLGEKWMAMTTAGYDSIDNTNGVMIKTAGYPAGFSSSATFGTILFSAKKAGSGTIKIGNNSLAFQASSQNAITGNAISFSVAAPVVAPVIPVAPEVVPVVNPVAVPPKSEVKKPVKISPETKSTTITTVATSTATATEAVAQVESTEVAAVGGASFSRNIWFWIAIAVLVLIDGVYLILRKKKGM